MHSNVTVKNVSGFTLAGPPCRLVGWLVGMSTNQSVIYCSTVVKRTTVLINNTVRAGQQGLKALTAAMKRTEKCALRLVVLADAVGLARLELLLDEIASSNWTLVAEPVRLHDVSFSYMQLRSLDLRDTSDKYLVLDLSTVDALASLLKQVADASSCVTRLTRWFTTRTLFNCGEGAELARGRKRVEKNFRFFFLGII